MNNTATAHPTPIPAFAPVLKPRLGSDVACVAVGVAVPGVPGGRLVDVGLKSLIQVIEPPLVVGKTWNFEKSAIGEEPIREDPPSGRLSRFEVVRQTQSLPI